MWYYKYECDCFIIWVFLDEWIFLVNGGIVSKDCYMYICKSNIVIII